MELEEKNGIARVNNAKSDEKMKKVEDYSMRIIRMYPSIWTRV